MKLNATILALLTGAVSIAIASSAVYAESMKDSRELVSLKKEWKDEIMHDMRNGLLPTLQNVINAVADGDMKAAAEAARARGMQHMMKMNKEMMANLPMGMKQIGGPMHKAFDAVADAAEKGEGPKVVMGKLGDVIDSCTACHTTYKFNP